MDKLTWQAYEFEKAERQPNWFAVLWIFVLALIIVAVILKSYLLAVFVLISGGVVHIFALKDPQLFSFSLTADNLTIGNKVHELTSFDSFWIFKRDNGNVLSLDDKKKLSFRLQVPLAKEISPETVRQTLAGALAEKEQEESLIDILARWLKF